MKNTNEVVLRIGSSDPFTHSKTTRSFSVKVNAGPGKVKQLMPDWSIAKYDLVREIKEYAVAEPMRFKLSRRQPQINVYRGEIDDATIDSVIAILKEFPAMFDLNNEKEYDRITAQPIRSKANESYWFEDLRVTKKQNVSKKKETYQIGGYIENELSGNEKKLRDALYIIGEEPTSLMDVTDLENLLWDKVTEEGSEQRGIFVNVYLDKGVTEKELEIKKFFKKGLALGIIDNKAGVYLLAKDRLGMEERECIAFLKDREKVFQFLVNQVAAKSTFEEDHDKGEKVKSDVTGKASAAKEAEEAMFNYIKQAFKDTFDFKRPDMVIKDMTLEEAVDRYAEECKKNDVNNVIPTVDALAELSAKATVES